MWWWLLAWRLVNCAVLQTQFDPDEFWQALEPAHLVVFGRGHLTWEWAPGVELRSWVHPLLLAAPMQLVAWVAPDSAYWAHMLPRMLVHGVLASLADGATCALAARLGGPNARAWALLFTASNWFIFYCMPRTYSNSLEAALHILALARFPLPGAPTASLRSALALASLGVMCRPSSVVIWLLLGPALVVDQPTWKAAASIVVYDVLPIAALSMGALLAVDSFMYGHVVFTPVNFVRVNVFTSISALYGTHPWHWYCSQCLPALLGASLPAYALGLASGVPAHNRLVAAVVFVVAVLSLSPHKELRFALPVLPICLAGAALGAARYFARRPTRKQVLGMFAVNAVPAAFLALVHQRAPLDAAAFLSSAPGVSHVDVLMPCHTMPHFSHVHRANVTLSFLDCSPPPLLLPQLDSARWARDSPAFVANAAELVATRFANASWTPSHVVTGARFAADVEGVLLPRGYAEIARWPWAQADVGGVLICYRRAAAVVVAP